MKRELPLRAALVLAEVADQVAEDEEVDRAEEVRAAEGESSLPDCRAPTMSTSDG